MTEKQAAFVSTEFRPRIRLRGGHVQDFWLHSFCRGAAGSNCQLAEQLLTLIEVEPGFRCEVPLCHWQKERSSALTLICGATGFEGSSESQYAGGIARKGSCG